MSQAKEDFVDEPLEPVAGTADAAAMSRGEPGLPGRFVWRGQEYRVAGVIRTWKTSGPCHSGGGEMYLRRHWFEIVTEPRLVMKVYCDRQAKNRRRPKARWWIFTVQAA